MNQSQGFKDAIKVFLNTEKTKNPNLAEALLRPKKSLNHCCQYIIEKVKEMNVTALTSEEVFSFAIEYCLSEKEYIPKNLNCKVVTSNLNNPSIKTNSQSINNKKSNSQLSIFDLLDETKN